MEAVQPLQRVLDAPEYQESLTLISDDKAPGAARSFTRSRLKAWGLADLLDRTVLIVSELITNAEQHGGARGFTAAGGSSLSAKPEHIVLTLAAQGGFVAIEVEDNSVLPPIPRLPSSDSIGGRGLRLVTAESDAWGFFVNEDGSGKRVFAFVSRQSPCPV
ncbi:ATP-binding protein [Streptomyces sp. NPDC057651]|uniref:ATP-binding protein n=1 Tax=unclassified Streptomyces TaxID=2593676 RepID=UPI0036897B04